VCVCMYICMYVYVCVYIRILRIIYTVQGGFDESR
jgi:hypothetical protein